MTTALIVTVIALCVALGVAHHYKKDRDTLARKLPQGYSLVWDTRRYTNYPDVIVKHLEEDLCVLKGKDLRMRAEICRHQNQAWRIWINSRQSLDCHGSSDRLPAAMRSWLKCRPVGIWNRVYNEWQTTSDPLTVKVTLWSKRPAYLPENSSEELPEDPHLIDLIDSVVESRYPTWPKEEEEGDSY